jgi:hypothetical protein
MAVKLSWFEGKYGLTPAEVRKLVNHPKHDLIIRRTNDFALANGANTASPLVRGFLMDLVNDPKFRESPEF